MKLRAALIVCAVAGSLLAAAAGPAFAYTFGEPGVRATGPEAKPFDWSLDNCGDENDIPDQPARAFRNAAGQVIFIDTHFTVRPSSGSSLATVQHNCNILMSSTNSSDPARFDNREWLGTTYTIDGTTVYGLIHNEFQGWQPAGYCLSPSEPWIDKQKCWYNSITATRSTNGGGTFTHLAAPSHYVASAPYRYEPGNGPAGFFQPSNIVRAADGLFYTLVHVEDSGVQPYGSCLFRTSNLADPTSWRAWGGTGFTVAFRNPYTSTYDPAEGVCAPVSRQHIGTLSESLTWSTYLKKWVLVGSSDNADGVNGPGFYYYTSDDLITWGPAKLLMKGELPWTHSCQDGNQQVRDPSLLDNDSESRNFDTIGQRPFLYFTRFNVQFSSPTSCFTNLDRDLIRIPVEFSNRQPGGPVAALQPSTLAPATGDQVTFDASGSSDPGGSIASYKWDLDGDGHYERDTGTNPVTRRAYGSPDKVTVTVRVCDNAGNATDETRVLNISGAPVAVPPASGDTPTSGACPQPPGGGGGGGTPGGGTGGGGGGTGGSGGGGGTGGAPGGGTGGTQGGGAAVAAPVGGSAPAPSAAGTVLPRFTVVGKPRGRRDGSVQLRVQAPAAGLFTVRGPGSRAAIRPVRAKAAKAGLVTITVRPSKAGLRVLRKKRSARVKAKLVFSPVSGTPQTATRVLTLRRR